MRVLKLAKTGSNCGRDTLTRPDHVKVVDPMTSWPRDRVPTL